MTETSFILNEEVIALISTMIITVLGGYFAKFKKKNGELRELIADIDDAIYDNQINEEEVRKIADSARRLANK